jgi:hypothetical protein
LVRDDFCVVGEGALFAFDDADEGLAAGWLDRPIPGARPIRLPFAPEAPLSGIGDTGYHRVVWYWIPVDARQLERAGKTDHDSSVLLHFGAVDAACDVWFDGVHIGAHRGGQTAFSFDVGAAVDTERTDHWICVRAVDDPLDMATPRGKQDWRPTQHGIWYERVTGLWRDVWLEAIPPLAIRDLEWEAFPFDRRVRVRVQLSSAPAPSAVIGVQLRLDDRLIAASTAEIDSRVGTIDLTFEANQMELSEMLWSPEHPTLIDAVVTVSSEPESGPTDAVKSYVGLRTVSSERGRFRLNERPYPIRAVLEQGYWEQSLFTPPSLAELRAEVELIKSLGFNAVRIHQKTEDPRFLQWADRLGLIVWVEAAAAFEFGSTAVANYVADWVRIVQSYRNHPSVAVWVPFNESWGIEDVANSERQRAFARGLTDLTRALDDSRLVVSNDGWEHTNSDLVTIHDYESSGAVLRDRYGSPTSEVLRAEPAGRAIALPGQALDGVPVLLTEFGGVAFDATGRSDSWGYSTVVDGAEFQRSLEEIFAAIHSSRLLAGFCYTQLTDTGLERNGLCTADRTPKLPPATIAAIVRGETLRVNDNSIVDDSSEIDVSVASP